MNQKRTISLTPPRISPAHIGEKITCIRAHRERIFQVATTVYGSQRIFHNYGHGGAGWTFLFGCVNESLRQFEQVVHTDPMLANKPIAVIGAGCYGLLTALMLARNGHRVRIIATDTERLPSYAAAGFFFPRPRKSSTPEERALFERLGMESYAMYQQIIKKQHPFITEGAQLLPAYYGCDIDPGFTPYIENHLMDPPEPVQINFGNGKEYTALRYTTLFINAPVIMHALHAERTRQNITITRTTVHDFSEIPEPIIFNCAGRAAAQLAGDTRMVPVQGHLIALTDQPSADQMQYMINFKVTMHDSPKGPRDELIYYAPKNDGILGITFIRGQDSLTANQHEFDRLIQRCIDYFGPFEVHSKQK